MSFTMKGTTCSNSWGLEFLREKLEDFNREIRTTQEIVCLEILQVES